MKPRKVIGMAFFVGALVATGAGAFYLSRNSIVDRKTAWDLVQEHPDRLVITPENGTGKPRYATPEEERQIQQAFAGIGDFLRAGKKVLDDSRLFKPL